MLKVLDGKYTLKKWPNLLQFSVPSMGIRQRYSASQHVLVTILPTATGDKIWMYTVRYYMQLLVYHSTKMQTWSSFEH